MTTCRSRRGLVAPSRLALAVILGLAGCQALEPTIGQRRAEPETDGSREPVLSLPLELPPPTPRREPASVISPHARAEQRILVPAALEGEETFRLELRDRPLGEAIHTIAEMGGVNVYLDSNLSQRVDASFPSVRLSDALRTLLLRNELQMTEDPPGVWWVSSHASNLPARAQFRVSSVNLNEVAGYLGNMVGAGTTVIVDAGRNLVVVSGSRADVDFVGEYLEAADRLQSQVLIEARIVEVTLDDRFELGISHDFGNLDIGDGAISVMQSLRTTNNGNFAISLADDDGDVDSTISALKQYLGLELISSPRVVAINGTQAKIEVVREIPYIQVTSTTTSGGGNLGTAVLEEVQFKEAGVKLSVTPAIQEDRVIQIQIVQELSEVVERFNGIPVIDTRMVSTSFQVGDGQTLVIGGLMQDRASKSDRGVPGLMNIPLLGRLFRSDEDQTEKRELILFLTPTIVDSGQASALTNTFRDVYRERRAALGLQDENGVGNASK